MPSTVWCARKAYYVRENTSEVTRLLREADPGGFIELSLFRRDPCIPDDELPREPVWCGVRHISAIEDLYVTPFEAQS